MHSLSKSNSVSLNYLESLIYINFLENYNMINLSYDIFQAIKDFIRLDGKPNYEELTQQSQQLFLFLLNNSFVFLLLSHAVENKIALESSIVWDSAK